VLVVPGKLVNIVTGGGRAGAGAWGGGGD
jgi:hypothetical protein